MDLNSVKLNSKSNTIYIVLSAILVILSIAGILLLFQIIKTGNQKTADTISNQETPTPTTNPIPTEVVDIKPSVKPTIALSPKVTQTASNSALKSNPTLKPTIAPKPTATSSANLQLFSSPDDKFSVSYSSSRKLVQDTESTGNRYTFSSANGNFAIHVATDGKWAWTNTSREFSTAFTVAGLPTFRYDITTQTIVDFQSNNKNFTIQCIHNGKSDLKTECDAFIKSIKVAAN